MTRQEASAKIAELMQAADAAWAHIEKLALEHELTVHRTYRRGEYGETFIPNAEAFTKHFGWEPSELCYGETTEGAIENYFGTQLPGWVSSSDMC